MALTYLPATSANAAVESTLPSSALLQAIQSTSDGSKTLTCQYASDAIRMLPGAVVTGGGISGTPATVSSVSGGVISCVGGTWSGTAAGNYTFTLSVFLGLNTASPGTTGANEVAGGSYARASLTNSSPVSGVKTSTNSQTITGMPAVSFSYFSFWSAVSSGSYLGGGSLGGTITVPVGTTVAAATGAISESVQG